MQHTAYRYIKHEKVRRKNNVNSLMSGHETNTVSRHTIPHSETPVAGPGRHIVGIGMEGETVHVGEVSVEDA